MNFNKALLSIFYITMPYSHFDLESLKKYLEQANLAGYIYQHQENILVLQEALDENGSLLNNFIQHEYSTDQLGLQFGLRLLDNKQWEFLIGVTHSNQDRSYEIGAGPLKGDDRAFNLLYTFYNYPKGFYKIHMPLVSTAQQLENSVETQLFNCEQMHFLDSAIKTNPMGEQVYWMKAFVLQEALNMKVRIQTAFFI